eukprot:Seg2163.3 transcript_id=Seg2163.3/GoldUCD/mRNA.D3Y31 product="hypothetical protein" protein_id=Seg2163.3/GoldUCD/D3Y31
MNSFGKKQLIPASKLHEDRVRWNDHVFTGQQMDKSLRQVGFGKPTIKPTIYKLENAGYARNLMLISIRIKCLIYFTLFTCLSLYNCTTCNKKIFLIILQDWLKLFQ